MMIDTGSVGESSYALEDSKVFTLPLMSQLMLGDEESAGVCGTDNNNASLNFEDLMSMKAPAGVDFHASYDEVPKAKVKIPKKQKAKKKNLNEFNKSCPSFGHEEKSDNENMKSRGQKSRKRISKRPQSAMERRAPSRSLSFTSSPPQHFDVELPKPRRIPPRRTKSLHSSFPVGGNFDQSFDETSQVRFSLGDGAFKPLHSSVSSFPAGRTGAGETDFTPMETTQRMHQSFTVTPSESGEFFAASLAQKEKIEHFKTARYQSKNGSLRRPRAPPRSRSEFGIVPVLKPSTATASVGDDKILASPRKHPSLPARSKSLNGLGLRIEVFKSPMKYDASKRKPLRRMLSQRSAATPESPGRQRAVLQRTLSLSSRPKRQHSPRRGKRPTLLSRSKSARAARSSGSLPTLESEPHKSTAKRNLPRRVKSLYAGQKKKSILRVHSNDPDHNSISAMHDSFSVSASESVPIATFAYSKNNPQSKSQIKKSNDKILSLLGKWKRKAKKEDEHTLRPLRSLDLELNDSKGSVPMTPETSISSEELSSSKRSQRKQSKRQSKKNTKGGGAKTSNVNAIQLPNIRRESARSHRHSEVQRRVDENVEKDSLADALETKEARLEGYMTRTPQNERKKVDRYWVEAFKRNYSRRSDSAPRGSGS